MASAAMALRSSSGKYSVASRAVGRPVEIQAYADLAWWWPNIRAAWPRPMSSSTFRRAAKT
jgi:hypothetical protein